MKSLALTFTRNNKTSIQYRGLIQPPLQPQGGNSTSVGGFYFGNYAPVGAIQPKEVAIAKVGLNLHRSKIVHLFFLKKESLL